MMGSADGAAAGVRKLLSPMSIFNGDILLSAPTPWGGTRAMLGDFTGHGLSAAMGALPLSDIFYGMTRKGYSLADLALESNRKLRRILPTGLFCACVLIDTDPLRRQVTVWNGGLPDVLVRGRDGGLRLRMRSTHLPLAIVGDEEFDASVESFELCAGDRLFAYSDGVIEAQSPDGTMFGSDRLGVWWTASRRASAVRRDLQGSERVPRQSRAKRRRHLARTRDARCSQRRRRIGGRRHARTSTAALAHGDRARPRSAAHGRSRAARDAEPARDPGAGKVPRETLRRARRTLLQRARARRAAPRLRAEGGDRRLPPLLRRAGPASRRARNGSRARRVRARRRRRSRRAVHSLDG